MTDNPTPSEEIPVELEYDPTYNPDGANLPETEFPPDEYPETDQTPEDLGTDDDDEEDA